MTRIYITSIQIGYLRLMSIMKTVIFITDIFLLMNVLATVIINKYSNLVRKQQKSYLTRNELFV